MASDFQQRIFSSFTSGALDIFNCLYVTLTKTTFIENSAISPIVDRAFRANAGGVAIGIKGIEFTNSTCSITVKDCRFLRNKAVPESIILSATEVLESKRFTGRGGGLGIYIQENVSVNVAVHNCLFEQNIAALFGGGAFILIDGAVSSHSISVVNSTFTKNVAEGSGGGGLYVGYITAVTAIHRIEATNCTFTGNSAIFGGGSYIFPGIGTGRTYDVAYRNCTFTDNHAVEYGAALGFSTLEFFESREDRSNVEIENW